MATSTAVTEAGSTTSAQADKCDAGTKCEQSSKCGASTQTDGLDDRSQVPDKQQLQITLLLISAALHLSEGLGDSLIQSEHSMKVEEWDAQLVTLGCGALSLLCDLLENKSWRAAAQEHQPLLLLHATYTGLQVSHHHSILRQSISSPFSYHCNDDCGDLHAGGKQSNHVRPVLTELSQP
jgi:hypothetical protein